MKHLKKLWFDLRRVDHDPDCAVPESLQKLIERLIILVSFGMLLASLYVSSLHVA